ncbi:MAG TPA: hypothetical protein VMB50_16695 [Myxococcales bacterium]|nr:hypothetical protein [Myxococcales bacterium]
MPLRQHYQAIGLDAADAEHFGKMLARLAASAEEHVPPAGGFQHRLWRDPSGAALELHIGQRGIDCVTPFFLAGERATRWRIRTGPVVRDPSCANCGGALCDVLDGNGDLLTRSTLQWLDFLPHESALASSATCEVEIVGFAVKAAFFESFAEFQAARPMKIAEKAFLPGDVLGGPGAGLATRATAMLIGRLTAVSQVCNEATGQPFLALTVDTYPGLLNVVLPAGGFEGAARVGCVAFIHAWLVVRPSGSFPSSG